MKLLRWLVLALALLAAPAAAQQDKQPAWYGVWKGKIGKYPVVACLAHDESWRVGAYYYLANLVPIALSGSEQPGHWPEEDAGEENGSSWDSVTVDGNRLRGTWTNGKRSLKISLKRQDWTPAVEFAGPCSSEAFLGPRSGGGRVEQSPANFEGQHYLKRTYIAPPQFEDVDIESFALVPAQPGDRAINAILAKDLPGKSFRSEMMQCMGWALDANGTDGFYALTSSPSLISRRWLGTTDAHETYCGGAHPSSWISFRAFDRETGKAVDPLDWLNRQAIEHRTYQGDPEGSVDAVRPELRTVILAHWPSDDDQDESEEAKEFEATCKDAIEQQEFWSIGLAREGMLFDPQLPHVIADRKNVV